MGKGRLLVPVPIDFPKHSMADDGYSLSESHIRGLDKALTQWKKRIEEYP